ncbi:hypothetical protein AAFF_G00270080 [Aldrovandia affinis]|uniref:Uncharacterized protein n=1 Tax=Aldrovandia affinis TaxID=143900 RepID=A0AAD7SSE2_9TELE|nr:hypothetical protein AAFF_G00270080 [Aldrovandia affinis]
MEVGGNDRKANRAAPLSRLTALRGCLTRSGRQVIGAPPPPGGGGAAVGEGEESDTRDPANTAPHYNDVLRDWALQRKQASPSPPSPFPARTPTSLTPLPPSLTPNLNTSADPRARSALCADSA